MRDTRAHRAHRARRGHQSRRPPALIASIALLLLPSAAGCEPTTSAGAGPGTGTGTGGSGAAPGTPLDDLTITVRLRRDRINTGGTVGSTITVQNRTDTAIVDPRCLLGGYSSGVIPAAEPRALLEFSTLVDCAGAFTYPPGFSETSDGPRFSARTSYGVELAAGDHLASIEFEGRRDRVAAPLVLE